MTITLSRSRVLLTIIWAIGFIIPMLILATQTIFGTVYHGKEAEAWNWFTPNIVPTIGLIVATLASTAFETGEGEKPVSGAFFIVTVAVSVLYVALFILIFLLAPLVDSPPLETFKRSSLFLGIIQGVVTTCLGVFFIKNAKPDKTRQNVAARRGHPKSAAHV
jgi:hypothetical protein